MPRSEPDSWAWRALYRAAPVFVLDAFLFSLRGILNPYLLFILLAVLDGTRV